MSFLTRFSLKNVSAVLILCILVILGGAYSTTKLKKETMPNISIPIVAVYTVYPGASPSDIQEKVTKPLENLVSSVNGIKSINSTSSENISIVVAEFDYSKNMTEMQRKIDDAIKSFSVPANAMAPKTYSISMGDLPVVSLSISNDKLAPEELEQKVRESIIPGLSGIEGVAQVQLASDSQKAVYIKLIPAKLKQYGLTTTTISQLIQANNFSIPAGSVSMNDKVEPIRVTGKINSIDELKNLQLPTMSGGQTEMTAEMKAKLAKLTPEMLAAMKPKPLTLGDVAEITLSTDKVTAYSRTNGNPSVILQVTKTQDANTVDVSDAVKKKLDVIKSNLPGGAGTEVKPILDQADYVKESINGMLREGIIGAIFAFIVILLFLRNFRTTIIACISIPLSVLFTLLFMKMLDITFYNMTLNILTLGGLSVAIGRIVDDSIVVIENIYRRLQTESIRNTELIKIAAKEVTTAITSSTLTTVSVFLPVIFVTGLAGVMFKPFALTVAIALVSSLLVAVTVIPLLSKLLLLKGKSIKHSDFHEGKIMKFYERILAWALNHKAIALITAFVLLIGSFSLVPFIGTSFIAEEKENYVNITINYPEGTDVKVINSKASEIEKALSKDSEVESYQTTVGTSTSNAMASMMGSGDSGSIMVELKKSSNIDNAIKKYKSKFAQNEGKAKISIVQSNPSSAGMGGINNVELQITGNDISKVKATAVKLTKELSTIKGLDEVANNLAESKPEISIQVDQKKAIQMGLTAAQVGMTIRELLNDSNVTTMTVNNRTMDVKLGIKINEFNKVEDIKSIELTSPLGMPVKVSDIADVREVPGKVSIFTADGKEYAKVTGVITAKDTGSVNSKVLKKVNSLNIPEGIDVKMGGVSEMMGDTFTQLGIAMLVAMFAVFLVMVIALGEVMAPLAILFSLPLAAIGGFIALFITGIPLDMPSMIGALMLIGIVVTNAIVLIDRVQHKRQEGMAVREALMEAGRVRMRPILMTAIATIAALLPLAFGFSKGSVMSQSLAVIVIGGLTTSTVLTLVIVPVAYEMLQNIKKRFIKTEAV